MTWCCPKCGYFDQKVKMAIRHFGPLADTTTPSHTCWHLPYGFVVLCFVVVMQSFIMNSHEVFIHIHQGCFAGTGAVVRLPQCQWSKPDGYGKISQCITTTKHSKAKTVCIFLGIYCTCKSHVWSLISKPYHLLGEIYKVFHIPLLGLCESPCWEGLLTSGSKTWGHITESSYPIKPHATFMVMSFWDWLWNHVMLVTCVYNLAKMCPYLTMFM